MVLSTPGLCFTSIIIDSVCVGPAKAPQTGPPSGQIESRNLDALPGSHSGLMAPLQRVKLHLISTVVLQNDVGSLLKHLQQFYLFQETLLSFAYYHFLIGRYSHSADILQVLGINLSTLQVQTIVSSRCFAQI